jgi:hypothetical protein
MNAVHVFDASALIALFRGNQPIFQSIEDADAGRKTVVWPAGAIGEANVYLRAGSGVWEPLLLGRVTVTELTCDGAIEAGLLTSHLPTGHVVHEARQTLGVVVTQDPDRYQPWPVGGYFLRLPNIIRIAIHRNASPITRPVILTPSRSDEPSASGTMPRL